MDPIDKLVGRRIRDLRQARDISQSQLGALVGITFQQVGKYETGENRVSASRLHAIAKALKAPVSSFFDTARLDGTDALDDDDGGHQDRDRLLEAFGRIKTRSLRKAVVAMAEAAAALSIKSV